MAPNCRHQRQIFSCSLQYLGQACSMEFSFFILLQFYQGVWECTRSRTRTGVIHVEFSALITTIPPANSFNVYDRNVVYLTVSHMTIEVLEKRQAWLRNWTFTSVLLNLKGSMWLVATNNTADSAYERGQEQIVGMFQDRKLIKGKDERKIKA